MEGYAGYKQTVADEIFPSAKWTMVGIISGRMLLMLISLKYLTVTKLYFYYELFAVLVDQCMPNIANTHLGNEFLNHEQQANFTEFYFSFWPSIVSLLVPQVTYSVSRIDLLFEQEDDVLILVVDGVICFIWLVIYCLLTHIVVQWIG